MMMSRRVWILLAISSLLTAASLAGEFKVSDPATAGFDTQALSKLDEAMQAHVSDGKLVGAMGLVSRGDRVILAKTWGQRNREKQLPMTEDTIFRIYSMSKPITSVGAMILVERGKLALDDPISKYLPKLSHMRVLDKTIGNDGDVSFEDVPAEREITVRDLLRHTSGFTYGFFGDSAVDKRYRRAGVLITDRTLEDTITKLAKIPLLYQPGTRWHYSVSTDVLGRVIEVASGQRFDKFLRQSIFEPLGMNDTFFMVPADKQHRLAQMYTPDGEGGLKPARAIRSLRFVSPANRFFSGGGGLCSTTADYLAFCRMLLKGGRHDGKQILQPKTVQTMHTNQLGKTVKRSLGFQFGLGFSINRSGVYSWGGAAGTKFWIDPKNEVIGIYMVQINPTGRFDFGPEMRRLVYAALK